jgi:hypothetical protein
MKRMWIDRVTNEVHDRAYFAAKVSGKEITKSHRYHGKGPQEEQQRDIDTDPRKERRDLESKLQAIAIRLPIEVRKITNFWLPRYKESREKVISLAKAHTDGSIEIDEQEEDPAEIGKRFLNLYTRIESHFGHTYLDKNHRGIYLLGEGLNWADVANWLIRFRPDRRAKDTRFEIELEGLHDKGKSHEAASKVYAAFEGTRSAISYVSGLNAMFHRDNLAEKYFDTESQAAMNIFIAGTLSLYFLDRARAFMSEYSLCFPRKKC